MPQYQQQPAAVALLAHVDGGQVRREFITAPTPDQDELQIDTNLATDRRVTAAIAALAASCWVKLDDTRHPTSTTGFEVSYWQLTPTGRRVLEAAAGTDV